MDPWLKVQETFLLAGNWAVNTLFSISNVGCQICSLVLEASEWCWWRSGADFLQQLPTCGMAEETSLGIEGCFQKECAVCWHVLSDLGIIFWRPELEKSEDGQLSFLLRFQCAFFPPLTQALTDFSGAEAQVWLHKEETRVAQVVANE